MGSGPRFLVALLGMGALASRQGMAQKPTPPVPAIQSDRCRLELVSVGDSGRVEETPEGTNYYAGGGVKLRCRGQQIFMNADSVAYYGGRRTEFIRNVHYRDSTMTLDADRLTYFRDGERFEARASVRMKNLKSGSTLAGPSVDHFRRASGVRDTAETYATGRARVEYATKDSAGKPGEPYIIVGDRIRLRGDDQIWAGGKVTIDRSDFAARGDSLRLDTGAGNDGTLLGGKPTLRGLGKDSFQLEGRRIDFTLQNRELDRLFARGAGHAVNAGWDLHADTISLDLNDRKLQQTLAWGDSTRPHAVSEAREIRADSLALDSPARQLREMRAFGTAWLGEKPDSATGDRDWLAGDSVVARFEPEDSAGTTRSRLRGLTARHAARAFYHAEERGSGRPSLNYVRGDDIRITMKPAGDGKVARVDVHGKVDGVQLEPSQGAARTP